MVVGSLKQETQLAVVGGGPGGYVAALRAADLGMEVLLIEQRGRLGGTCLLEGCIPSKTLVHAVSLVESAKEARSIGLDFNDPSVDLARLRGFTDSVVAGLSQGIDGLLRRRGVEVVHGRATFDGPHSLRVEGADVAGVEFRDCIVATGSRINELPAAYDLPLWTSAEALRLPKLPHSLLVVGGGYIGLEMGLVYAGLGSQVQVAEFSPRLLQGADPDLVDIMLRSAGRRLAGLHTNSKVVGVVASGGGYAVTLERDGERRVEEYEEVLVAVGRRPNTDGLGLERLGLALDAHGRIPVDSQGRSALPQIRAIGDAVPGPMLAHKASREAKVAAEALAGLPSAFDNRAIPAVVFTDPEIAWAGITEQEAKERELPVEVGRFPLSALGRARTLGRADGLVKVISEPGTGLILGVGMVGPMASELISEGTLAVEMGATLEDLMVTIHPHPTLSEAWMEAAEVAAGHSTHLPPRRKS